jgi:hypothetical protein
MQPDWVIKPEEWVPQPRPGGRRGWLVLLAGALRHKKPDKIVFVGKAAAAIRRRCAGISRGMAPKVLLAAPAQPSNRAARGRAL